MGRFVEETLKDDKNFDYAGLVSDDDGRKDRLRFWNDELCRKKPHTFDIVLAVSGLAFLFRTNCPHLTCHLFLPARRRRNCPLRILALPAHRATRRIFRAWLTWVFDKI